MARRKQWIVKYTFPPTAWEEGTSFCVPPLCLMQNPIGNTCGTWAATALLLITCHPCPFNSVCFLFSVLSPRLIKKGYAIIRYTQAEFKCGKYDPSFCCTKIWSNKILYSLNWMFSLYILLWDLLSNVWILGSFCVCLCSCLGKVRVCVRGEFIRGDMSISGGVQKAEAKVIGQAGGIRQLSLTIKTYCVPVLVCVFVCVRACMSLGGPRCGSEATEPRLGTDTQLPVCGLWHLLLQQAWRHKLKQSPLKDKVLFYFSVSHLFKWYSPCTPWSY